MYGSNVMSIFLEIITESLMLSYCPRCPPRLRHWINLFCIVLLLLQLLFFLTLKLNFSIMNNFEKYKKGAKRTSNSTNLSTIIKVIAFGFISWIHFYAPIFLFRIEISHMGNLSSVSHYILIISTPLHILKIQYLNDK